MAKAPLPRVGGRFSIGLMTPPKKLKSSLGKSHISKNMECPDLGIRWGGNKSGHLPFLPIGPQWSKIVQKRAKKNRPPSAAKKSDFLYINIPKKKVVSLYQLPPPKKKPKYPKKIHKYPSKKRTKEKYRDFFFARNFSFFGAKISKKISKKKYPKK